ncbi:MAG: Tn3 family transposase [Candidatus Obscuribacterales bacterium]|nr:Tn3 family transposase [Candidatus Obscuribacterales bacterium]
MNANPTRKELQQLFTPTPEEKEFAWKRTSSEIQTLRLLTWLKLFQRLGYFPSPDEISARIIDHVANAAGVAQWPDALGSYEGSSLKWVHHSLVREYLQVTAYGDAARKAAHEACLEASTTRDDLVDIVNVAIEELIRQRHELPAYSTLVRIARTARQRINSEYHLLVFQRFSEKTRDTLGKLFEGSGKKFKTAWDSVKTEPNNPTVRHMQDFLNHIETLSEHDLRAEAFAGIPAVKIAQFAAEARSLDVASMRDFSETKRLTLAGALVLAQVGRAYDDVADMFIRLVQRLHSRAREALVQHRIDKVGETDKLIATLHEVSLAFKNAENESERLTAIEAIIGEDIEAIIARCEKHAVLAGNNHLPLLLKFYKGQRSPLLNFLSNVSLVSTSQDASVVAAIEFVVSNKSSRTEWLPAPSLNLSFASDKWMALVTGNKNPNAPFDKVHRRYLELCVFTQVMNELKSGDLYIPHSDRFRDYRDQLIAWEDYEREIELYGRQSGMEIDPKLFIAALKTEFEKFAEEADRGFPANEYLSLENGEPVLKRLTARLSPSGQDTFEATVREYMEENDVLNILWETENWLNWTKHFGPISGLDAKIEDPRERYVITAFCYGCNLGPTQTARSIKLADRRQISFINQRHITEQKLNEAIVEVINAYRNFPLQRLWGLGKTGSADGTKWDLYPQNLMSEYHIRYGGYGGIGYYLIADSYIALFSRFNTCGSWEGHYILDFITENDSEVKPDTVHSDTQGQSEPIFGLAYLLGIKLMPRIRNWKNLHFYKPDKLTEYEHIGALFSSEPIDWNLIEKMLPDMLRVALSVKTGKITPSAILRRLGTYSRKNKLYFAFRELGRVIRTTFLLRYISDVEVRRMISVATNKSERFNQFADFLLFGNKGVITENVRDEQRKIIKYNHLVANLAILHTLVTMSGALEKMSRDGHVFDRTAVACLSPYQTEYMNRFGSFKLRKAKAISSLERAMNITLFDDIMHSVNV